MVRSDSWDEQRYFTVWWFQQQHIIAYNSTIAYNGILYIYNKIYIYVHTYTHKGIHTYIHADMQTCRHTDIQTCTYTSTFTFTLHLHLHYIHMGIRYGSKMSHKSWLGPAAAAKDLRVPKKWTHDASGAEISWLLPTIGGWCTGLTDRWGSWWLGLAMRMAWISMPCVPHCTTQLPGNGFYIAPSFLKMVTGWCQWHWELPSGKLT